MDGKERNISNLDPSGKETPTDKGKNFLSYCGQIYDFFSHVQKKLSYSFILPLRDAAEFFIAGI